MVEEMEEQRGESRSWGQGGHRQRGSEKASRGVRGYVLEGMGVREGPDHGNRALCKWGEGFRGGEVRTNSLPIWPLRAGTQT